MKYQWLTRLVVLGTPIIWIIYDLWTYYYNGNPSTESATIFRYSVQAPGIAFLAGVLAGHFFFQMHEPTAYPTEPKK
jgi:hypothetical protein